MPEHYQVVWTDIAEKDVEEIVGFIADDSPQSAWQIFLKLRRAANTLHRSPLRCRIVPELRWRGILIYRELIVRPYRIIFKIAEDGILILGVFDGRRNLDDVIFERLLIF
jgi:plasmid stabilization system protein ParE